MPSLLIVLAPLVLLLIWAAVFDLRRRRRHRSSDVNIHDADAGIRNAKGKGTSWMM